MKAPAAAALVAFMVCILAAMNISAATLVVTKTEDTNDGTCDADCSLREAVAAAATDDTVVFSSLFNTPQTITLIQGQITITRNLTVTGPGPDLLTVSGNNATRIFFISSAPSITISGLRISDGLASSFLDEAGGGIYVLSSSLNLTNMSITNNRARVLEQPREGKGGGIYRAGNGILTIVNTTISGNSADGNGGGLGGGIYSGGGTIYVLNSSIFNNRAPNGGGGFYNVGVFFYLTNSTVSGNTSFPVNSLHCVGGGIYNDNSFGMVTLTSSTITGNSASYGGGGICNLGTVVTRNSIVAGNGLAPAPDLSGPVLSEGNNLIGSTSGNSGWVATDLQNIDPRLGPLGNNGGVTWTHALLPNSPAINAGNNDLARDPSNNSILIYDQRGLGFARVIGASVDIGAFEANVVTVGGRVTTPSGRGIAGVRMTFTAGGITLYSQTNPFGYYRFVNLPSGTYSVAVTHKYYLFEPPQYVTIDQNRSDLNFVAREKF